MSAPDEQETRAIVREVARGVLYEVDDQWMYACPHCENAIPGLNGPKGDRPDLPPIPRDASGVYPDMEKIASYFEHKPDCVVTRARALVASWEQTGSEASQ